MTTSTITDFINDVRQLPHGLVVVAGPAKSGKTNTMLLLESAISKMNRGNYFRIGIHPPKKNNPLVHFIPTFDTTIENLDDIKTIEESQAAHRDLKERWKKWERKMKFTIAPNDPAGLFIDDLDKQAQGLCVNVIDMALMGVLTVVSVEAKTAEQAVLFIREAAEASSYQGSPILAALKAVIVQESVIDPDTGDTVINAKVVEIDDDFREAIASFD